MTLEERAWETANEIGWHYIKLEQDCGLNHTNDAPFWRQKGAIVEIIRKHFDIPTPLVNHGTFVLELTRENK